MTFFSHRPGFSNFPSLLPIIFRIFTLLNVVHDPFLTRKTPFLLFSYFRAYLTTLLLKILGGRMHGPSPTSNFGGTVPPVPLPSQHWNFFPIHCPNGRLGQDLGFGGFAFALKLPELLNTKFANRYI